MKTRYIRLILATFFVMTSCTTTQHLSSEDKQRIKKIHVSEYVKKPSEMYYLAPGANVGLTNLFGGQMAAVQASKGAGAALEEYARQNDIFIEKLVREILIKELNKSNRYELVDRQEADALILIEILNYGFQRSGGFGGKILPVLSVKCEMYDTAGTKLWQAGDTVEAFGNPAKAFKPSDAEDNPDLLRQAWELAADKVAKDIVADL